MRKINWFGWGIVTQVISGIAMVVWLPVHVFFSEVLVVALISAAITVTFLSGLFVFGALDVVYGSARYRGDPDKQVGDLG